MDRMKQKLKFISGEQVVPEEMEASERHGTIWGQALSKRIADGQAELRPAESLL
jgi:hypothetical protein